MSSGLLDIFWVFARLGLLSFGGGNVSLAELHRESVGRGWLTDSEFIQAYAIGLMTPGPGTLFVVPMGFGAAGIAGAITAAVGFFLPTGLVALAVICAWGRLRKSRWPAAIRDVLIPVAVGLSLASLYTMGRAGITDLGSLVIAALAALCFWRARFPTPLVLMAGGTAGALILGH